ncbi:MAG: membrane protein insertase YidC [Thermodesulfovibrionales bacterium]
MDRNTILAVVLSMAVIMGYYYLFPAPPAQPPAPVPASTSSQEPAKAAAPATAPAAAAGAAVKAPVEEKEIRIETPLYSAVLSSRGGAATSWALKNYKDEKGNPVVLLKKAGPVPGFAAAAGPGFELSSANFSVIGGDLALDAKNPSGTVTFEHQSQGQSLRRTFTFYHDSYKVDLVDESAGIPEYWISVGADFGIFSPDASEHTGPVLLSGTNLEEIKAKKLAEPAVFTRDVKWIGQEDKYFCAAVVPAAAAEEARAWKTGDVPVIALKAKPGRNSFTLYAGPKQHDVLARLGIGLEHIVNFGFFSIIARPLFWILKFFYGFTGNYGWAIVLITIVTRIPFIPLINKSQESMRKMQEIQPKMAEIREKYKKDPQRMQKELTDLYKKNKVNPVGGCLPMLLQIPVFIALYKVLGVAIELRGAPYMLWIVDLAAKDPYYILPVLMGVTMLAQQKMTPTSMDPTQAKIMLLMPVIFTFMFLNFASGLVLYWLVNNIFGIIQQFYLNRKNRRLAVQAAGS